MTDQRVVAVLGVGVVPPETPILRADDLGAVRGDGIFETMHVRNGSAWLLDVHLARMAQSASRAELALPPAGDLTELAEQALTAWPADAEGALRLVCTRGTEANPTGPVTVFATIGGVTEIMTRARHEGVRVVTAQLGVPADLRARSPWLLGGAKTLSYAVNMASLRWAASRGAQDVLWISSEGFALEAPTATLMWLEGKVLHMVPPDESGILAGITARYLWDHADTLGWTTATRMITPEALHGCDGAWLLSSVRGVAPVRSLDDVALAHDGEVTASVRKVLGFI